MSENLLELDFHFIVIKRLFTFCHYNYLLQFRQNNKICAQTFLAFEVKMSKLHSNNEQMCGKLSLGRIFTSSTILGDKHQRVDLKVSVF